MTRKLASIALAAVVSLAVAQAAQARYTIGNFEDGTAQGWAFDPDPEAQDADIAANTSYTSVLGTTLYGNDLAPGGTDDFSNVARGKRTLEISMLGENSAGQVGIRYWGLTLDVMARPDASAILDAFEDADSISYTMMWDHTSMNNGVPGNGTGDPVETFDGYSQANEMAFSTALDGGDTAIFAQRAFSGTNWQDQDSIPSAPEGQTDAPDAKWEGESGPSKITYNFAHPTTTAFTWIDNESDGGFTDIADIGAFVAANRAAIEAAGVFWIYIALQLEEDPDTVNPLVWVDDIIINTPILDGDVNADDIVDVLDIAPFIAVIGGSGAGVEEADMNSDTNYDVLDIAPFIDAVGGGDVSTIPEPASLALLGLGGLALLRRRG